MWQPDGWGDRARIGVLVLHNDVVPEGEFQAMAPEGVSVHTGRIPFGSRTIPNVVPVDDVRTLAEPPHIDQVAALVADAPLDVICYGFTSMSYLLGGEGDKSLQSRLQGCTGGIPVLVTGLSASLALRALGVRKLQMFGPPWFPDELDRLGATYFRDQGFDVVRSSHVDLPRGQMDLGPAEVYKWVCDHIEPEAEGVFMGGNGFRVVGIIHALEQHLEVPVVSANQALFWHALRIQKVDSSLTTYGRVFDEPLP